MTIISNIQSNTINFSTGAYVNVINPLASEQEHLFQEEQQGGVGLEPEPGPEQERQGPQAGPAAVCVRASDPKPVRVAAAGPFSGRL